MAESLKQKTISGMIWNATERFGSSLLLFISNLILARLLTPDDFGCIGMLLVFISVSEAIIDGGFGSALIQKKNPTKEDYSTVFYWNLTLSLFLYVSLFMLAPQIAVFYDIPLLCKVLRIEGIVLVVNSLYLVQQNILKKEIRFREIARCNLGAVVFGTIVGIWMAYMGYGIWSLVMKILVTSVTKCIAYWMTGKWKPQFLFTKTSFFNLFSFGSFMFLNTMINNIYQNMLSLFIGKNFSAASLGYFSQARKMEDIPRDSLSAVINNVTFPIFSQLQDDKDQLRSAARKCLALLTYMGFPLMMLMISISSPLILLLFTSKWQQTIPYFQILCLHGLIYIPFSVNVNIIQSLGKSKLLFYIMLTQGLLGISMAFSGAYFGVKGVLAGFVMSAYISYFIISVYCGRLIGYGIRKQLKDVLQSFSIASISFLATRVCHFFIGEFPHFVELIILSVVYLSCFLGLSKLLRSSEFTEIRTLLKNNIRFR